MKRFSGKIKSTRKSAHQTTLGPVGVYSLQRGQGRSFIVLWMVHLRQAVLDLPRQGSVPEAMFPPRKSNRFFSLTGTLAAAAAAVVRGQSKQDV